LLHIAYIELSFKIKFTDQKRTILMQRYIATLFGAERGTSQRNLDRGGDSHESTSEFARQAFGIIKRARYLSLEDALPQGVDLTYHEDEHFRSLTHTIPDGISHKVWRWDLRPSPMPDDPDEWPINQGSEGIVWPTFTICSSNPQGAYIKVQRSLKPCGRYMPFPKSMEPVYKPSVWDGYSFGNGQPHIPMPDTNDSRMAAYGTLNALRSVLGQKISDFVQLSSSQLPADIKNLFLPEA
jgi:hypothetical protein